MATPRAIDEDPAPSRSDRPVATYSPAELTDLIARVLENSRVAPGTARIVAEALLRAEADGISSHGVARVPPYAAQAMTGKVDGMVAPTVTCPAAAALPDHSHPRL